MKSVGSTDTNEPTDHAELSRIASERDASWDALVKANGELRDLQILAWRQIAALVRAMDAHEQKVLKLFQYCNLCDAAAAKLEADRVAQNVACGVGFPVHA